MSHLNEKTVRVCDPLFDVLSLGWDADFCLLAIVGLPVMGVAFRSLSGLLNTTGGGSCFERLSSAGRAESGSGAECRLFDERDAYDDGFCLVVGRVDGCGPQTLTIRSGAHTKCCQR